jgi:hypothetical protein
MSVRCKFKVDSVEGGHIVMTPVYADSPENKAFFQATPSGKLEFYCVNDDATAQLSVGVEYYIDIAPAG